jgi:siroheme synthase
VHQSGLGSPALIVVGDVVRLAQGEALKDAMQAAA